MDQFTDRWVTRYGRLSLKHTRRSKLSDLDKGSNKLGDEAVASGDVRVLLVSLCEVADDPPGLTEVKVCSLRTKSMPWLLCE